MSDYYDMAHNVLDPGPRDPSVLTLQALHRSTNIFQGEVCIIYRWSLACVYANIDILLE